MKHHMTVSLFMTIYTEQVNEHPVGCTQRTSSWLSTLSKQMSILLVVHREPLHDAIRVSNNELKINGSSFVIFCRIANQQVTTCFIVRHASTIDVGMLGKMSSACWLCTSCSIYIVPFCLCVLYIGLYAGHMHLHWLCRGRSYGGMTVIVLSGCTQVFLSSLTSAETSNTLSRYDHLLGFEIKNLLVLKLCSQVNEHPVGGCTHWDCPPLPGS